MTRRKTEVRFNDFDLAGLAWLVAREIEKAEALLKRVNEPDCRIDPENIAGTRTYLSLLLGCRAAIAAAMKSSLRKRQRQALRPRRLRPVKLRLDVPGMADRMMAELRAGRRVHIDCGTIRGRAKAAKEDAS